MITGIIKWCYGDEIRQTADAHSEMLKGHTISELTGNSLTGKTTVSTIFNEVFKNSAWKACFKSDVKQAIREGLGEYLAEQKGRTVALLTPLAANLIKDGMRKSEESSQITRDINKITQFFIGLPVTFGFLTNDEIKAVVTEQHNKVFKELISFVNARLEEDTSTILSSVKESLPGSKCFTDEEIKNTIVTVKGDRFLRNLSKLRKNHEVRKTKNGSETVYTLSRDEKIKIATLKKNETESPLETKTNKISEASNKFGIRTRIYEFNTLVIDDKTRNTRVIQWTAEHTQLDEKKRAEGILSGLVDRYTNIRTTAITPLTRSMILNAAMTNSDIRNNLTKQEIKAAVDRETKNEQAV